LSSASSHAHSSASGGSGSTNASGGGRPLSLGARMLAKMGYREGRGLGKDGTGLLTPLVHHKTGPRSGVIRLADGGTVKGSALLAGGGGSGGGGDPGEAHATFLSTVVAGAGVAPGGSAAGGGSGTAPAATAQQQPAPPSRVLCLSNVAGPGDVDDELEAEVRDECAAKYGRVEAVFVYEAPAASVPDEEAVRIIVAFDGAASAARAPSITRRQVWPPSLLRSRAPKCPAAQPSRGLSKCSAVMLTRAGTWAWAQVLPASSL
jgi:splicing factor 45